MKILRVSSWIGSIAAMAMFWNVVYKSGLALHEKGAVWESVKVVGSIVLIFAIALGNVSNKEESK